MATHSSILAWRIPRTEEPGGGGGGWGWGSPARAVGHDLATVQQGYWTEETRAPRSGGGNAPAAESMVAREGHTSGEGAGQGSRSGLKKLT